MDAFQGIPLEVLSSVRDDLIVVNRSLALVTAPGLVSFTPSTLRVAAPHAGKVDILQQKYSSLLNTTILPTRYVDTDLMDTRILFSSDFFAERSIRGWARVSLYFARLCAKMEEMGKESGLKSEYVFHAGTDSTLIPSEFKDGLGQEMQLITP